MVDEFQNTSRQGIYAVGDVCGKALLTPGNLPLSTNAYVKTTVLYVLVCREIIFEPCHSDVPKCNCMCYWTESIT